MKNAIVAILLVVLMLLAAPAAAETMTGIWRINGLILIIRQDGTDITIRTAIKRDDTGLVWLTLKGTVKPSVSEEGGLNILAEGSPFPILHQGKRCQALPLLGAGGQLLGDVPGRIFRGGGALGGLIECSGEIVGEWNIDLSGTWR